MHWITIRTSITTGLFMVLFTLVACHGTQEANTRAQAPAPAVDPSAQETPGFRSQQELIPLLRTRSSTDDLMDLRLKTHIIADYAIGMIGQAADETIELEDLDPEQRVWVQRVKLDMARAMVSIASAEDPVNNLFQELFVIRIGRTIVERDVERNLGSMGDRLLEAFTTIDDVIWNATEIYIDKPLEPLQADVELWFASYGHKATRYWWPRELDLLVAETVNTAPYRGLFAAVNRANDQIDRMSQLLNQTSYLVEHLPLLFGWQIDLEIAELMAVPEIQDLKAAPRQLSDSMEGLGGSIVYGFDNLTSNMEELNSTLEGSAERLDGSINSLNEGFLRTRETLATALNDFSGSLGRQTEHLSTTLEESAGSINLGTEQVSESMDDLASGLSNERELIFDTIDQQAGTLQATGAELIDTLILRIGLAVGVGVFAALVLGGLVGALMMKVLAPRRQGTG